MGHLFLKNVDLVVIRLQKDSCSLQGMSWRSRPLSGAPSKDLSQVPLMSLTF